MSGLILARRAMLRPKAAAPSAPISLSQQKILPNGSGTRTLTLDAPVAAGDVAVAFITRNNYSNLSFTLTGLGATWTTRQQVYDTPNGGVTPMFYGLTGIGVTAGDTQITITPPDSSNYEVWVGIFAATKGDATAYVSSQLGLGDTATCTAGAVPALTGQCVVTGVAIRNNNTVSSITDTPFPWTAVTSPGTTSPDSCAQQGAYILATADGNMQRTYNLAGGTFWRAVAIVLQ